MAAEMAEGMFIEPTLSVATANRTWDAIVIGAGPSGALTAIELARKGFETLLVERCSLPRFKVCGGCLNQHALAALRSVRLEHVLQASKAAPLRSLVLQSVNNRAEIQLDSGMAIERSQFDAALVRFAIDAGAHFLPDTLATVEAATHKKRSYRSVRFRTRDRDPEVARARVVVAADGLGHPSLQRLTEFSCRVKPRSRIGLGATIAAGPASYRPGTIYMAIARDGYVGLVRTTYGRLNVAAAVDANCLKASRSPHQVVNHILASANFDDLLPPVAVNWHGTGLLTRTSRRLASHRLVLLGDATGYTEPFTGQGMTWALSSALTLIPRVIELLERGNTAVIRSWAIQQRLRMFREQLACRALAGLLRRPAIVNAGLMVVGTWPSVVTPLVYYLHGRRAGLPVDLA